MKLKELIVQYAAFRKSMGADFESAESLLNTFCRRMGVEIDIGEIQAEQVAVFLAGTGPVNRYWRRKYDTLRGLYRYATSRGFVDYVPLPATVPKMAERMVPYIYNTGELQRLINPAAPDQIGFRKLQPHTFRAVLLLLYGAGLRIGEAVALTLQDLDLDAAVITIRDTKFHKTRLVPVGLKLNQAMAQYAAQRKEASHSQNADAPFFVLRRGGALSVQIVKQAFRYPRVGKRSLDSTARAGCDSGPSSACRSTRRAAAPATTRVLLAVDSCAGQRHRIGSYPGGAADSVHTLPSRYSRHASPG